MAGLRPPGTLGGFPPSYYGQHPGTHFRPPGYPLIPPSTNPSFQSMTAHWNISAPPPHPSASSYHPHTVPSHGFMGSVPGVTAPHSVTSVHSGGGGGSSKNKHSNLGQFGLTMQQPKPPEKPLLPYMRYSRKMWEQLKSEGKRVWEVGKIIGQKWRELSEEEKQPYNDEYEAEKAIYTEQQKVYRNSPAYKKWLEAKQQAENVAREAASREAAAAASNGRNEYGPPPPSVIAPPRQTSAEARIQMVQQEEDEEDEYITMKQLAAVRYHRNHRLMLEIFSDSKIPSTRSAVTNSRLGVLKKQVTSLTLHQKKLETEFRTIDEHYEAKKKKFLENSDKFRRELKRIHDNPLTTWKKPALSLWTKDIPVPSTNAKYKPL